MYVKMGNLQHPPQKPAVVSGMEHMLFGANRCIFEIIPLLRYDIDNIGLIISSLFTLHKHYDRGEGDEKLHCIKLLTTTLQQCQCTTSFLLSFT